MVWKDRRLTARGAWYETRCHFSIRRVRGGHGFLRRPFGRHVIRPDFKGRRSGAAGKAPGHEEIGGAAWGKGA